jgi:hypothetical protein
MSFFTRLTSITYPKAALLAVVLCLGSIPALAKGVQNADFSEEAPGAEAKAFSSLIGNWHTDRDGSRTVYAVDGRSWEQGVMAPAAGAKAKALYGDSSAAFLHDLETYRYFPLSVAKDVKTFKEGTIEATFKPVSGRIDQAAGIAFNLKPNGDYLVIRANALENNVVFFKMEQGRRSTVQWNGKVPVATGQWQTLRVVVSGKKIEGYLNNTKCVDYTWKETVDGRIGLWSKADSYIFFGNFSVKQK